MSQSVDTKIVELKFNNDNFKEKVDSTLSKLEQLNKDIDTVGTGKAFKNLAKDINKVDVSSVSKGVEEASKGFSKLEVVGITALANISNAAVNLGKKMVSKLISPITQGVMQGGLARARNIEQATFQFEGLKIQKSDPTLSYYSEVMDAVLGTSYSYDVAAKAASQLAASNIGVTDTTRKLASGSEITAKVMTSDMTKALLGIAGVASMTGSDFDSIAQIFTRVAGQGKVMANDLNSIASRGLNAAAVLANSLGKTEEQVRDMVSKGQISFEEFSNAMSEAYGSHAKDSTLMFQGAMDDVQAALARIGADFYGPALNAGRDILNSITPVVDAIHNRLNPALEASGNIMQVASKKMSQYSDMLAYLIERFPNDKDSMSDWISEHMNAWTNISDLYKRGNLKEAINGLEDYTKALDGMEGVGINGQQMIADYFGIDKDAATLSKYLKITKDQADELVETEAVTAEDIGKVIDGMIKDGTIGFNEFYKSFKKLLGEDPKLMGISGLTTEFDNYLRSVIAADEPTERFTRHVEVFFGIIKGSQSLIKSFGTMLSGFVDIFVALAGYLEPLGPLLLQVAEETAQFVVQVADFLATSESFKTVIEGVIGLIDKIFSLINVSKIAGAVLLGISKIFEFISTVIERVASGIAKVVETVRNIFDKIVDKITEIISNSEELSKVLHSLRNAGIVVALINIANALAKPAELLKALTKSVDNVSGSIVGALKSIGDVFKSIAGLSGKIGKAIDEVIDTLKRMQELIVATAILEIAFAIGVLAAALYLLSKVNIEKAADAIFPLVGFFSILFGLVGFGKTMKSMSSTAKIWQKSVNSVKDIATACIELAVSIAIIAAAMKLLSTIKPKQLLYSLGAVELLLVTLALIAKMLSGTTTKTTGLKALWSGKETTTSMTKGVLGLVAMAEAVKILAQALTEVATVAGDPMVLWQSMGVIEALLLSCMVVVKVLSKEKPDKVTKGVSALLAMAIAIRLLTKPMSELAALASMDSNSLWTAFSIIGLTLAAMTALTKWLSGSKGILKGGAAILVVAFSIKMLGQTLSELANVAAIDNTALWSGLGIIALGLTAIVLALDLLKPESLLAKSMAFIAVAAALQILSNVILAFGNAGDAAWAGLGVVALSLITLAGACALFNKVPVLGILKLFLTLALGAVIVAAFGAAIGIFGVGIGIFGAGLTILASSAKAVSDVAGTLIGIMIGFALAIGILSSVGLPAVGVIFALSIAFLMLGAAMMLIGTGLTDAATGIKMLCDMKSDLGSTASQLAIFLDKLKALTDDAEAIGESFKTISEPLSSMKDSVAAVTADLEKLISAYTDLTTKTADAMTSMAESLTTISTLNKDSFTSASEAVTAFIDSLSGISSDAETVATTAGNIKTNLEELRETFRLVTDVVDNFKKRSVKVFDDLGNSLNNIATPIQVLNNLKSQLDGMANELIDFVNQLMTMQDSAATVSEGATEISEALQKIADAAKAASDGFSGLNEYTASVLSELGAGITSIADGMNKLVAVKDELGPAADAIASFYDRLSNLNATASTISSGTKQVASAIKSLGSAAAKTASASQKGMSSAGEAMVGGLASGIKSKSKNVSSTVNSIVTTAANSVRSQRSSFYSVGSYLIGGMVSGIASQQGSLSYQVQQLEAKAERAVRAKAKIKSPSRVWMRIGAYMGEGLAIGIANTGDQVRDASLNLASVSEDAMRSAVVAITDAMNDSWNTDPIISPVVDLSSVRQGAKFVNSVFGSHFGLQGDTLVASISHTIQNGGKTGVESSINDLTDKLESMTETMNSRALNNYITISGNEDPDAFADSLTRRFRLNARTI